MLMTMYAHHYAFITIALFILCCVVIIFLQKVLMLTATFKTNQMGGYNLVELVFVAHNLYLV